MHPGSPATQAAPGDARLAPVLAPAPAPALAWAMPPAAGALQAPSRHASGRLAWRFCGITVRLAYGSKGACPSLVRTSCVFIVVSLPYHVNLVCPKGKTVNVALHHRRHLAYLSPAHF